MSDIGPDEVQKGIESTGYMAALAGLFLSTIALWWRRLLNRMTFVENNMVHKEDFNRSVDKLENTFVNMHNITHEKTNKLSEQIDANQKEMMNHIIELSKKSNK